MDDERKAASARLRQQMPENAQFIDEMAEAFGRDAFKVTYASENGHEIGKKSEERGLTMEHIHTGPLSVRKD